MAIAFKSTSNTAGTLSAGTSQTLPAPTGTVAGDYTVVLVVSNATSAGVTFPSGSGWTFLGSNGSTSGSTVQMYGRLWSAAPTTTTITSSVSAIRVYYYLSFSGVDTGSPTVGSSVQATAGTATTHTSDTISNTLANTATLGFFGVNLGGDITWTKGSTFTLGVDVAGVSSNSFISGPSEYRLDGAAANRTADASTSTAQGPWRCITVLRAAVENTAPTITAGPTVAYQGTGVLGGGALTRLGLNNSATITATATDTEQTAAGALTFSVRTSATIGGGTLVHSSTGTSGTEKVITVTDADPTLTTSGAKTLYLHVSDGTNTTVSASFTVNVDVDVPTTTTPTYTITTDYPSWRPSFTPSDTTSTGTNALDYVLSASNLVTGAHLTSTLRTTTGTVTSPVSVHDTELVVGNNTRYLHIEDSGGNTSTTTLTIVYSQSRSWNAILPVPVSGNDGHFGTDNSTVFSTTATIIEMGWVSSSARRAGFAGFQPNNSRSVNPVEARLWLINNDSQVPATLRIRVGLTNEVPTSQTNGVALSKSTDFVDWTTSSWVNTTPQVSPDLSALIDQVTRQSGWVAGNNLVLYLEDPNAYAAINSSALHTLDRNTSMGIYTNDPYLFFAWTTNIAPSVTGISHSTVTEAKEYTLSFTPDDDYDTSLTWTLFAADDVTQIANGTCTDGVAYTSPLITDTALVAGSNTRILRVYDLRGDSVATTVTINTTQTYDEVSTAASVIFSVETQNVEALTIEQTTTTALLAYSVEGDSVQALTIEQTTTTALLLYAVKGGIDGKLYVETELVSVLNFFGGGTHSMLMDTHMNTASLLYSVEAATESLTIVQNNAGSPVGVVSGGTSTTDHSELSGLSETILVSDSDILVMVMDDVASVEVVRVRTTGVDISDEPDTSNPQIIPVETTGSESFVLGPQVYEDLDDITTIPVVRMGSDTENIVETAEVHIFLIVTSGSVDYMSPVYRELNGLTVVQVETPPGLRNLNMVAISAVGALHSVETGIDTLHVTHVENPSVAGVISQGEGSLILDQTTTVANLIPVSSTGSHTFLMDETEDSTHLHPFTGGSVDIHQMEDGGPALIVQAITRGLDGSSIDEAQEIVVIRVLTGGVDQRLLRQALRYFRSSLNTADPYLASTLRGIHPYSRSRLVTVQKHGQTTLKGH